MKESRIVESRLIHSMIKRIKEQTQEEVAQAQADPSAAAACRQEVDAASEDEEHRQAVASQASGKDDGTFVFSFGVEFIDIQMAIAKRALRDGGFTHVGFAVRAMAAVEVHDGSLPVGANSRVTDSG